MLAHELLYRTPAQACDNRIMTGGFYEFEEARMTIALEPLEAFKPRSSSTETIGEQLVRLSCLFVSVINHIESRLLPFGQSLLPVAKTL